MIVDKAYISKETACLNEDRESSTTQSPDLVFLEESKQLVCLKCYKEHFVKQNFRVFKEQGNCQCVFPECCETNPESFKIIVSYKVKGEKVLRTECLRCIEETDIEILNVLLSRTESAHKCKRTWTEAFDSESKKALCEYLLVVSFNDKLKISNFEWISHAKRHFSKYISGCSLIVERSNCHLTNVWSKNLTNSRNREQTVALLKTVLEGEVPWIQTSPDFLFSITEKNRKVLLNRARERLLALADHQPEINKILLELIENCQDEESRNTVCFFLDGTSILQAYRIISKEGEIDASKVTNLALTAMLSLSKEEWSKLEPKFKKDLEQRLLTKLSCQPHTAAILATCDKMNSILEKLPTYDLEATIPKESMLIGISDKLHFYLKQIVYGDCTVEEGLDNLLLVLSDLKHQLCISNSIDYSYKTASFLNPNQKTRLLYCTPVVNAVLTTAQLLKEELYKACKFDMYFHQFEELFTELFSIMHALAKDCYDIALLWLSNCKTLVCPEILPERNRIQFESLFCAVFKYLWSLSDETVFRKMLMELQLEVVCEFYGCTYRTKHGISRLTYQNSKLRDMKFELAEHFQVYLLSKFYPSSSIMEEDEKSKQIKAICAEINISFNYAMECFILPSIDIEFVSKTKLLLQKPVLESKKVVSCSQIKRILASKSVDKWTKLVLTTHFLAEDSRLTCNPISLAVLNTITGGDLSSPSVSDLDVVQKCSSLTFKLRICMTKEKAEIISKYLSLAEEFISSEVDLLSKLKLFCAANSVLNVFEKEIRFYELNYCKIDLALIRAAIFESQEAQLNSFDDSSLAARIENFKRGNTLVFRNETEMESFIQDLSSRKFAKIEVFSEKDVAIHSNKAAELLHCTSELTIHQCFAALIRFWKEERMEDVQLKLDLLLNLVSEDNSLKIKASDLKNVLSCLASSLIYFWTQYIGAVEGKTYTEVRTAYFNAVMKLIKLFRTLVDSNNMEMRRLFSEEKITVENTVIVDESITTERHKGETTFLKVLVSCTDSFLVLACSELESDYETDNRVRVFHCMLDLMSEIIEGNSSANFDFSIILLDHFFILLDELQKFPEIVRTVEDFYIKVCFEVNATEKHREDISNSLDKKMLAERIKNLKKIDFVREVLESEEKDKPGKLVELYYSDRNKDLEEFNKVLKVFLHLKFHAKYDFSSDKDSEELLHIVQLLERVSRTVEINIDDEIKQISFLTSPDSLLFSGETINTFVEHVNRAKTASKNQDTVDYTLHFMDEIEYVKHNLSFGWKKVASKLNLRLLLLFCLAITVVYVYFMIKHTNVATKQLYSSLKPYFFALIILQLILSTGVLFLWFTVKFQLAYNLTLMQHRVSNNLEKGEESSRDRLNCKLSVVTSSLEPFCFFTIVGTNILALSDNSLYWTVSLQLLCFISFSRNLTNIIKAIQLRGKQLGLISIFLAILLLIYGVFTFNYMSDSFQTSDGEMLCLTLAHCLASQLDYGIRMGGGMGDNMPVQEWQSDLFWSKFVYSMVHYILFPVVMLNIVAGIIIDTFADLREKAAQLEEDIYSVCLVCGGTKDDIKKEEGSYDRHIKEKHYILNYMLFIQYVVERAEKDLDYCETFVRHQINKGETKWFPSNEEDLEAKIDKLEEKLKSEMNERMDRMEQNIREEVKSSSKTVLNHLIALKQRENVFGRGSEGNLKTRILENSKLRAFAGLLPETIRKILKESEKYCVKQSRARKQDVQPFQLFGRT